MKAPLLESQESLLTHIQDTRMLLVISNFGHLANAIIPSMLAQLEVALNVSMMDDRQVQYHIGQGNLCLFSSNQTLMTVVKELDKTLFEGYVKPRAKIVTDIVRGGILDPQMDWYETPHPTGQYSPFPHGIRPILPQKSALTCMRP